MDVIDPKFADILDKQGFAFIATVDEDCRPHNTPVWFEWNGEHVLISQTKSKVKYKNMNQNPHVAVSISDPDDPYRNIQIRGHVADISRDDDNNFIDALAKAYTGADSYTYDPPGTERFIVAIAPEHVTTYG